MPPGTYAVTMAFRGHQARQTVEVQPDPRSKNTAADWQRRWDAILRASALQDAATAAVWRIRNTRDDAALVEARARQAAEAAGEKDKKALAELPLVKSAGRLKEGLTALEKKLWQSPESKGILPETDVMSPIFTVGWMLQSSWDAPNANHLERLRQAEARLRAFLAEADSYFDRDVAGFRREAEAAGFALMASPAAKLP